MDFNLIKVVLLVLFVCSVDGQSCQDSCRTVCDPLLPSTEGTNIAVQRGKKGPKGDFGPKGEKGNPGKDNSEVVGENKREIENLKFENHQQRERLDEISGRLAVEETKNKELLSLVKNISMCTPPTIANVTFAGDRFSHGDVIRARVDCDVMHFGEGATERRCVSRNIVPDFYSVPLSCKKKYHLIKEYMSWDSARLHCKKFYKDLIHDGIETTEKRKKICDFLKDQNNLFVGIRLSGYKPINMNYGSLGDDFNFQWAPGYPNRRDDHNIAVLMCSSNNEYRGKFASIHPNTRRYFICQNF